MPTARLPPKPVLKAVGVALRGGNGETAGQQTGAGLVVVVLAAKAEIRIVGPT